MIPASYSFLNDFDNCAFKAFRKFVKRDLPKETSPELERGIATHTLLEAYINGSQPPPKKAEYEPFVTPLIKQGAKAEVKLGMTKDFQPAEFFGDPWLRGKVDVLVMNPPDAFIVDWKTGKSDRENPNELRIQALLVRANYPSVTRISGCYVWLKEDRMGKIYDLTDINQIYQDVGRAIEQAEFCEREGEWPVNPNPLCGYCPVKDCRFNYDARANK